MLRVRCSPTKLGASTRIDRVQLAFRNMDADRVQRMLYRRVLESHIPSC